jgi:hypothetical protein
MNAYSSDLGAKMAQACDEGAASRRQLARQFRVSVAFLQKMLRRRRLTGRLAAAAHTCLRGCPAIWPEALVFCQTRSRKFSGVGG